MANLTDILFSLKASPPAASLTTMPMAGALPF
jgi:hypothetical protein